MIQQYKILNIQTFPESKNRSYTVAQIDFGPKFLAKFLYFEVLMLQHWYHIILICAQIQQKQSKRQYFWCKHYIFVIKIFNICPKSRQMCQYLDEWPSYDDKITYAVPLLWSSYTPALITFCSKFFCSSYTVEAKLVLKHRKGLY